MVLIGICSLGPGVDAPPGWNGPVVSPSSSSLRSSVCYKRGSLSSCLHDVILNKYFLYFQYTMAVTERHLPTFEEKTPKALKADRVRHRVTFNPRKASPEEILRVAVPKLEEGVVLVPGSLALVFNLTVSGHANNFLVNNVTRALVSRMMVKFAGETLQDTNAYDVYKLFEDLFLPVEKRSNMFLEGIQFEDLCKIRSNAGDKKTSGVDVEK